MNRVLRREAKAKTEQALAGQPLRNFRIWLYADSYTTIEATDFFAAVKVAQYRAKHCYPFRAPVKIEDWGPVVS